MGPRPPRTHLISWVRDNLEPAAARMGARTLVKVELLISFRVAGRMQPKTCWKNDEGLRFRLIEEQEASSVS